MSKYVFFTGGVVSGLGKGITAASLGTLFKARGYSVAFLRFNPFFNIDSSNLSPQLHGDIYITEDGRACDLVVGHYERLLGENLHSHNDVTSGEIYSAVIAKERLRAFKGSTVQVVPHITDEIKKYALSANKIQGKNGENSQADIVIVEVGGTVGDIETQPYLEAIRQLRSDLGKNNVAYVHVSLVNYIDVSGEQKTKPTQHSVRELQNLGIRPDVIVCRTDYPLEQSSRNKLSLFCNVDKDCIIENILNGNIYEIPANLEREGFCKVILRHLKMEDKTPDLSKFHALNEKINKSKSQTDVLKIGILSGFAGNFNSHMSLRQALTLGAAYNGSGIEIVEIFNRELDEKSIAGLDGLIVTESVLDKTADVAEAVDATGAVDSNEDSCGKNIDDYSRERALIAYAKDKKLPLLLIDNACLLALSSQDTGPLASSAFAYESTCSAAQAVDSTKAQCGIKVVSANCIQPKSNLKQKSMHNGSCLKVAENPVSNNSDRPVAEIRKEDCQNYDLCDSYVCDERLGARKTLFIKGTMLYDLYGKESMERHNKHFCIDRSIFDKAGYLVSGISETNLTVDAFELQGHGFFVGVAFHPEFSVKSDKPDKLIGKFLTESLNAKIAAKK